MRRKRHARVRNPPDPLDVKKKTFKRDLTLGDDHARRVREKMVIKYKRILREKVGGPDIYDQISAALADLGRFDEAEKYCRNGLAFFPKYWALYNIMGLIRRRTGKPAAAIPYYDKAIKYYEKIEGDKRDLSFIYNNKGAALFDLGKKEGALECYNIAIKENPDYTLACFNKYQTLIALSREDEAGAFLKEQFGRYMNLSEMLNEYAKIRADAETIKRLIKR